MSSSRSSRPPRPSQPSRSAGPAEPAGPSPSGPAGSPTGSTGPTGPAGSSKLPLLLACGGSFLAFLDVTITNLAVPDLATDFGVGVTSVSWVVTLYTILFAALLAPAGRLADLMGRVRLFGVGMAVFTLASLLAALAPTFAVLLVARALQGVGAALLMPASLAFVLADTPPARRAAAIGMWSASASLAAVAGPALGGVLVDTVGWRALFCINVPLGALLIAYGRRLPVVTRVPGRLPDTLGTVALTGGIGLVVLGLTQIEHRGWGDPATLGCLLGGLAATAAAFARSARHPSPAVETGLWRNRTYAGANAVSLLFGAALFASLLLGVLVLVNLWGYSALRAGLAMTPGALSSAAVGILINRMGRQLSPRLLVVGGGLVFGATCAVLAVLLPEEPNFLGYWLPGGLCMGVGIGATSVGVSSAAALSVAPVRFAAATGLNIAARQVGGAFGIAILAVLLDGHTAADGADPYTVSYLMVAAASAAAGLVGLALALPAPEPASQPAPAPVPAPAAPAVPSQTPSPSPADSPALPAAPAGSAPARPVASAVASAQADAQADASARGGEGR